VYPEGIQIQFIFSITEICELVLFFEIFVAIYLIYRYLFIANSYLRTNR